MLDVKKYSGNNSRHSKNRVEHMMESIEIDSIKCISKCLPILFWDIGSHQEHSRHKIRPSYFRNNDHQNLSKKPCRNQTRAKVDHSHEQQQKTPNVGKDQ